MRDIAPSTCRQRKPLDGVCHQLAQALQSALVIGVACMDI